MERSHRHSRVNNRQSFLIELEDGVTDSFVKVANIMKHHRIIWWLQKNNLCGFRIPILVRDGSNNDQYG